MIKIGKSQLHSYSLGIVAANKPLDTNDIEVVPLEDFPMFDGELTDNIVQYKAESQNARGTKFSVDMKTTNSIRATWLPLGNSNRVTSPDVRRGESVQIYRFADTDEYWWDTLKNDPALRRLETVIYSFSNNSKENVPNTPDSTYWLEVNTHRKLIHLHTSNNDGEPFTYDIQINAKEGKVIITDDANNSFTIDSANSSVTLMNASKSSIVLKGKEATITADTTTISGKLIVKGDITAEGSTATVNGNLGVKGNVSTDGTSTSNGTNTASNFIQR